MTDKQTDTKTYNCVYCNKTLTKFETQSLYKDGEFLTTCEECWNKHAKEAGHVVSDVQTINITIDDLINGNLRDMEFTAQFGVYRQAVKGLAEQLKRKNQECEELNKEIHNLNSTIDFIKVTEHSAINNYNKLKQALNTIAYSDQCNRCDGCGYDNGCMDNNCALYIARKALENDK